MAIKEQHFYSQIGQISIGFSNLESQIKDLIYILTKSDDEFVNSILLEDNSITQNLKLLLKLCKYHEIEEDRIRALHHSINKIRINRNLFIHGLWSFNETENGLMFVCEIKKVAFKPVPLGFTKILNKFLEFRPQDFQEELTQIANCSKIAKEIIETLKENRYW
ncbi:hypothetical protein [Flavobacterium frigidarium]|jgi:hypothetical protein|uniref:Uncharacterized protein n=1 Tax=Flavobacterium frigidarium TaxID=99286 RepID=A0ABV4KBX6_9FLAO